MKYFRVISLLAGLLMIGCSTYEGASDDEAAKLANDFLMAVQQEDFDKAFSMVDEEFFQARSRQAWISYYKNVNEVLGKRTGGKLKQKNTGDRYTGTFHMYQFAMQYEKGLSRETLTMIQKINSDAPLKIFGHRLESSKLPQEF